MQRSCTSANTVSVSPPHVFELSRAEASEQPAATHLTTDGTEEQEAPMTENRETRKRFHILARLKRAPVRKVSVLNYEPDAALFHSVPSRCALVRTDVLVAASGRKEPPIAGNKASGNLFMYIIRSMLDFR